MKKLISLGLSVSVVIVLMAAGSCKQEPRSMFPEKARKIAEEAYIYAYPMLENYRTMRTMAVNEGSPGFEAPFNEFKHYMRLLDHTFTQVVAPNNDTLYSISWLDLRSGPIVLSVPAVPKDRYYSFQMVDMYTHNFAYVGSRATGYGAGHYLIAGPGWKGRTPSGIAKVLRSEGNFVFNLGRTEVRDAADVKNAIAIQKRYRLTPLNSFLGLNPKESVPMTFPPYDQKKAESIEFISYLNFLLGQVAPHPDEKLLWERFARIGIGPNRPFDTATLDPALREAMEEGIANAVKKIKAETLKMGEMKNGWQMTYGIFGSREDMQGKYLTRAAAAMGALYGNTLAEAFYPFGLADAEGDPLDGSQQNYILHFAKDRLPPVNAFWSVTMYKLPERLFSANDINRYSIGDRTEGLKYGDDGSLTVYIQHRSPGKDKESNWLPAPDGPFTLYARLYWPKKEAIDGTWVPPAVAKTEASSTALQVSPREALAYTIGVQAYIYAFPLVELYRTFYEQTLDPKRGYEKTVNQFNHVRGLVKAGDDWVVTPNNDTLYSRAWVDVTREPVVLVIPEIRDRAWWFPIGDFYHRFNANLSWDTVGPAGGNFALVPPGWQGVLPEDVRRVDLGTPMAWFVGRLAVSGPDDVPKATALQDKCALVPLSLWGKKFADAAPGGHSAYPVYRIEDPLDWFAIMNEMLRRNPPPARDEAMFGLFKEIGFHPSQKFDPRNVDDDTRRGLERAIETARAIIEERTRAVGRMINGWSEAFGPADAGTDFVYRAAYAWIGLLYNQAEVSTYHVGFLDAEGKPFDPKARYVLHFDVPPPVEAFWSVTMYDAESKLFVANAINRYSIGDRTPGIKYGENGSLAIYIQHQEPTDPIQKANWLPAPDRPFYVILREYSPRADILTRTWEPPAIRKIK